MVKRLATFLQKNGFKVKGEHWFTAYEDDGKTTHYMPDLVAERGEDRFIIEYVRRLTSLSIRHVPAESLRGYTFALVSSLDSPSRWIKRALTSSPIPCELWFYDYAHKRLDRFALRMMSENGTRVLS